MKPLRVISFLVFLVTDRGTIDNFALRDKMWTPLFIWNSWHSCLVRVIRAWWRRAKLIGFLSSITSSAWPERRLTDPDANWVVLVVGCRSVPGDVVSTTLGFFLVNAIVKHHCDNVPMSPLSTSKPGVCSKQTALVSETFGSFCVVVKFVRFLVMHNYLKRIDALNSSQESSRYAGLNPSCKTK